MSNETIVQSSLGQTYFWRETEKQPLGGAVKRSMNILVQPPMSPPDALLDYRSVHSERVITREELASGVWKLRFDSRSRAIDQTVSQARKRLEPDERILTVHGFGYRHQRMTR